MDARVTGCNKRAVDVMSTISENNNLTEMAMPNPITVTAKGLTTVVGVVGSLFLKRGPDGKVNIALAPLSVVLMLTTSVTCSAQKSEPFSVCVRATVQSLKELVYAN